MLLEIWTIPIDASNNGEMDADLILPGHITEALFIYRICIIGSLTTHQSQDRRCIWLSASRFMVGIHHQ